MRLGPFKPSNGPALFTTRAVLSGSADNFSINSATVIAPSPKVTPEHALHLRIFCKAANEAEQAAIDHSGCIRQGWDAVKSAGRAQRLKPHPAPSARKPTGNCN